MDLSRQIQLLSSHSGEIILMMDANADYADDEFSLFLESTEDLHQTSSPPATYQRGNQKMDYILGTAKISATVSKGDLKTFDDRLEFSDHRVKVIDLKEREILMTKMMTRL